MHDHTLMGPFYAERHRDLPVVTTNHGPFASDLGPIYRDLPPKVGLIAISQHQASLAEDTPITAVIHHGLDCDQFQVGDGDGGYALFLGRMCAEKGVDRAIRVARRAGVPLRIGAKLCEPAEHTYFREKVEPNLGGDIVYVGEVGGRQKVDLLAGATCLLNPIAWPEPFGMVMIEALASATPVVATSCGATAEIVDDGVTGFLADDEVDLARAVRAAGRLDRQACRESAEVRFSAARMAKEHLELYERVMDQTPSRGRPMLASVDGASRPGPSHVARRSPVTEAGPGEPVARPYRSAAATTTSASTANATGTISTGASASAVVPTPEA